MSIQTEDIGNRAHGDTDDGNPVKIGGVAMTANPTKVADGKRAHLRTDAVGRALVVPYQVRELISTAYVSLTTGTETTLLAGIAGTFLDLVAVTATNNSTAAIQVDLRDATGGGIIDTLYLPATDTKTINYSAPKVQNTAAAAWTADLPDVTGTTVTLSATFIQNL